MKHSEAPPGSFDFWRERLNIGRDQYDALTHYQDALKKWNQIINLISKETIDAIWWRHLYDSAQMIKPMNQLGMPKHVIDLGAGGGLPGCVLTILLPETHVHLVESDQRKCAFLHRMKGELNLPITVHNKRIEDFSIAEIKNVSRETPMMITGRALASLEKLCQFAHPWMGINRYCLFSKGAQWRSEIEITKETWHLDFETFPSETHSESVMIAIKTLEPKE